MPNSRLNTFVESLKGKTKQSVIAVQEFIDSHASSSLRNLLTVDTTEYAAYQQFIRSIPLAYITALSCSSAPFVDTDNNDIATNVGILQSNLMQLRNKANTLSLFQQESKETREHILAELARVGADIDKAARPNLVSGTDAKQGAEDTITKLEQQLKKLKILYLETKIKVDENDHSPIIELYKLYSTDSRCLEIFLQLVNISEKEMTTGARAHYTTVCLREIGNNITANLKQISDDITLRDLLKVSVKDWPQSKTTIDHALKIALAPMDKQITDDESDGSKQQHLVKQKEHADMTLDIFQKKCAALEQENTFLKSNLKTIKKTAVEGLHKLQSLESERDKFKSQLSEKEIQLSELQEETKSFTEHNRKQEQILIDARETIEDLRFTLKESESRRAEFEWLKFEWSEFERAELEFTTAQNEFQKEKKSLEDKISDQKKQINTKNDKLAALKSEINNLKMKMSNAKVIQTGKAETTETRSQTTQEEPQAAAAHGSSPLSNAPDSKSTDDTFDLPTDLPSTVNFSLQLGENSMPSSTTVSDENTTASANEPTSVDVASSQDSLHSTRRNDSFTRDHRTVKLEDEEENENAERLPTNCQNSNGDCSATRSTPFTAGANRQETDTKKLLSTQQILPNTKIVQTGSSESSENTIPKTMFSDQANGTNMSSSVEDNQPTTVLTQLRWRTEATLRRLAEATFMHQLNAGDYHANKSIINELNQKIADLTRHNFETAKTKLSTELVTENAGTFAENTLIERLIDTPLDDDNDDGGSTLQTRAEAIAENLSREYMGQYGAPTSDALAKVYRDTAEAITNLTARLMWAQLTLTARESRKWMEMEIGGLQQVCDDIENGVLVNEKEFLLEKMENTNGLLNRQKKKNYEKSIKSIDDIIKKKSQIKEYQKLLDTAKTKLEEHIERNNKSSNSILISTGCPATRADKILQCDTDIASARNELNEQLSTPQAAISTYNPDASLYRTQNFKTGETLMLGMNFKNKPGRGDERVLTVKMCKKEGKSICSVDSYNGDPSYRDKKKFWFFSNKDPCDTLQASQFLVQTISENAQDTGETPDKKGRGILTINGHQTGSLLLYAKVLARRRLYPEQSSFSILLIEGALQRSLLQGGKEGEAFNKKLEQLVAEEMQELEKQSLQNGTDKGIEDRNIRRAACTA
jgi:hypothetical protein